MASTSATSGTSSRPSSNPRDSPAPTGGRQKSTPNGLRSRPKPSQNEPVVGSATESSSSDRHSHDRLLFLTACAVGCSAIITTVSGDSFSGIFSGASLEKSGSRYVLKMAKRNFVGKEQQANGAIESSDYTGHGPDHVMAFDPSDVSVCTISGLQIDKPSSKVANGTANSFRTDTDISGNLGTRERELKPWDGMLDSSLDTSLNANGHATWDQFEANERLYGVKTDYDEAMYTTSIDRSHPSYRQRAAAAEKKAREIEASASSNVHRAALENELDEEERFSGVNRDVQPLGPTNPNSYKPPARRAPTGAPTVSGAPVDPAIISSSLAQPDGALKPLSKSPAPASSATIPPVGDQKENLIPSAEDATAGQTRTTKEAPEGDLAKAKLDARMELQSSKTIKPGPIPSPGKSINAAETVEQDVFRAFKDFSNHERMRAQEKQRNQGRKEREVKINDLKKFASNFRLSKPVPDDLIGILAKDKRKQDEIIAKAHKEAEEKKLAQQKPAPPPPEQPKAQVPSQPDSAGGKPPPAAPVEPRGRGQGRGYQNARKDNFQNSYGPGGVGRGGAPPQSFGQRLTKQYGPGPLPPMPAMGPLHTDMPFRQSISGAPSSASSLSRFNAAAIEFRPNAAASTFSPSVNPSSMTTSQAGSRPVSKTHSPTKRSFFDGNRPKPFSERPSIRDDFNPIKRLKKEVVAEGKSKDFEPNDGIPFAYMTRPTWDVRQENENKSYADMFDIRHNIPMPSIMQLPHQHQLPPHLQQQNPPMMPHASGPHHAPRFSQPPPIHPQYQHDDHRMQASASQQSSYQSPRVQHNMLAQPSPMQGQSQPVYMQPQQMYVNQQGMPMGYMRPASATPQMFNPQTGQPMVMNAPPGAQYVPAHGQPHMQVYSPAPAQAYPQQPGPGTPSYSPRAPPMMVQQGSQQGHGAPMMYMSQSQQGQPVYYSQPQGQPMPMRGGYPMQPQNSYGASPHPQPQYPMQHRPPQQFGGYNQMHPGQMGHQHIPHSEVK